MKMEANVMAEALNYELKQGLRDRLNLIAAAEAHVVWKNRLGQRVHGMSSASLGSALLGQDGICQLGNLIDGPAFSVFKGLEEFGQLRDAHHRFHLLGHEVVKQLEVNDRLAAASLFDNEYSLALSKILQCLSKINKLLAG